MMYRLENEPKGPAGLAMGHRTFVSVEETEHSGVWKVLLPKHNVNKTEFKSTKSFENQH